MQRIVVPEILDSLPAGDPEAIRSRRELRLINALMGNHRWLARKITAAWQPGDTLLELGAGDGTLCTRLAKVLPHSALAAVDIAPRPLLWPAGATWHQRDLFAAPLPDARIVAANLFLHHFTEDSLAHIGAMIPSSCHLLLFSEPARRRLHLWQGSLLAGIARFGRVTRHDMAVSIRAGFLGGELPRALGTGWRFRVSTTLLGAYRCEANRH